MISLKVPGETTVNAQLFALVDAVAHSKLTRREKSDALAGLCDRLADFRRQRFVLQRLASLDEQRCKTLLRPILAKLPSDVGEYWTSDVPYYSQVIVQLHDDEIWKEYLKIAKRTAVGLRMEMLGVMNYGGMETNTGRRLAFLAAFLDDATVRYAGQSDGPCAAFIFRKIQVRDFAAMEIASLLSFDEQPTEFWTDDQWAQLRSKVRTALSKHKLPGGAR